MTTCNNIILSQPQTGATLNHEIPDDVSARLNFGPEDISGLRIGDAGELIISFAQGGQLNITNFDDVVDNGNLLYLEDGTLIDPSILTSSLKSPQDFNNIETAAGAAINADAIKINQPAANTVQEISAQTGQEYVCDFDPSNANVELRDGKMYLTFADGSQIVINNFEQAQLPAALIPAQEVLTEVTEVAQPVEEILQIATAGEAEPLQVANVEPQVTTQESVAEQIAMIEPAAGEPSDLAQQLAQIAPAAGEGASGNSGYGFSSTADSASFTGAAAIGPINATALAYNAPSVQPERFINLDDAPVAFSSSTVVDETDTVNGTLTTEGKLNVDFGADGAGSIGPNGSFNATCELTNNTLSSGGVVVDVERTTDGYIGTANGETVFTFVIDANTGEYVYTQVKPLDHGLTTQDNEEICLDFGIVVTDSDGDRATTVIRVRVLDDAPVIGDDVNTIDETDLSGGPVVVQDRVSVDFGQDGPGTIAPEGEFTSGGSRANNALTSNGVAVVVTQTADGYVGVANGVTVFTMEIDPATGEYTFTQFENLDHADGNDDNDVISLNFPISITDFDGDSESGVITINVKDDAPDAIDDAVTVDGVQPVEGNVLDNDDAGSDDSKFSVTNPGTYVGQFGTLVLNADGSYIYTRSGNDGGVDTFEYEVCDSDGDTDTAILTITVEDNMLPIDINGAGQTDDTNLVRGDDVENGVINVNYQGDDAGATTGNGAFDSSGQQTGNGLSSNGVSVEVTFDANTNTYTGVAGNVTVFTMVINADATYTFTQIEPLDHSDTNSDNEALFLDFGVTATDGDGDTGTGTVRITVLDDGPSIVTRAQEVYEDNIGDASATITGTLTHGFGQDGPGAIEPNGNTSAKFSVGGQDQVLTSNGVAITITQTATGYVGAAGGVDIFTFSINPTTGEYTYTQLGPVDHPASAAGDEVIWLKLGVTITDNDGDSKDGYIVMDIHDSVPHANDDVLQLSESNTATGNVLANDDQGQDGNGVVTIVTFEGQDYAVPENGTVTVQGNYGTLVLESNGDYSYQANDLNSDETDLFSYTMRDADGDTSTANLSIAITHENDVPTIATSVTGVNEVDLCDHPLVVNKTFVHDFGEDGAGRFEANGETAVKFQVGGQNQTLTSNGTEVVITNTATGYVGKAGNLTVFTMTLNANTGEYTYTQFAGVDHPGVGASGTADVIWLKLGVSIIDADGDRADAYVNIDIRDTAPEANADTNSAAEGETVSANVMTNDVNCEAGSAVCEVTFNGTAYAVNETGATVVTGAYGVLTIDADGIYTYKANSNNPDGVDVFGYTMKDQDGDTSSSTLSITVTHENDVPTIEMSVTGVNETSLCNGPAVVTKTLVHDFGDDGAGSINTNGTVLTLFQVGGQNQTLTANGIPVAITQTANGYVGKAGGETIFTLSIDSQTGEYTYTQLSGVDHPGVGATGTNDVIWLKFGVTIKDVDGDSADAFIQIDIRDDAPEAVDDKVFATGSATFESLDLSLSSNDVNGTQSSFTRDGITIQSNNGEDLRWVDVADGSSGVGIAGNGSDVVWSGGEVMQVRFAGDVSAATLAIGEVANNIGNTLTYTVYLADGTTVNETHTLTNGNVSNGVADLNVSGYGSAIVGVDLTGGASFVLQDVQALAVDYAVNDAQGNVLTNDHEACGDDTAVTSIKFGNQSYDVPEGGQRVIQGDNGTLTIKSDGTYSYQANAGTPSQTVHTFSVDSPGGSDIAGDIKNVSTSYNATTKQFTFSMVVEPIATGIEFAINGGPNPKGHPGELAFFYIDGTSADPVATVYGYNGNSVHSWQDGSDADGVQSPDKILSSLSNPGAFDNISVTTDANGNKVFSITMDVTSIQNHNPAYGPDGIWTGVEFADEVGIWSHPVSGLETSYGNDGFLTDWDWDNLGWYDSSDMQTQTTIIPGTSGGEDAFTYTITDADGDTSTATLEICIKDFDNVVEINANGDFFGTDDGDVFLFNALSNAGEVRLNNFNLDEDAVDLSNVVQGFDPLTDAINEFVYVTENNGDTVISIDQDGAGGSTTRDLVARLDNVTGETLADLIENGNIIV